MFGLLARLSPEQLDEWQAFDALEGNALGPAELRGILSRIGSYLAAAQGAEIPPQRFLPARDGDEATLEMQSVEEQVAILERMAAR